MACWLSWRALFSVISSVDRVSAAPTLLGREPNLGEDSVVPHSFPEGKSGTYVLSAWAVPSKNLVGWRFILSACSAK